MVSRLRGRLQVYRFATRFWHIYSGCVVIGVTCSVLALITKALVWMVFAAAAVAVGVALFTYEEIVERRRSRRLVVERIESSALRGVRLSTTYDEYDIFEVHGYFAAYSRAVNAMLNGHALPIKWLARPYHVSGTATQVRWSTLHQKVRTGAVIFNEAKVRLLSDLTVERIERGDPLQLQKTDYFSSLCTNEIVMQRISSAGRAEPLLDGMRLLSAADGVVLELAESALSNHIGLSTIALTRDSHLVVARQGKRNAQGSGLLSPAGSGSLDYSDLERGGVDLGRVLKAAMQRELIEECGLTNKDLRIQTYLIGFARLLNRGGKPEFFGFSIVDAMFHELNIPRAERDFIASIEGIPLDSADIDAVQACLDTFARKNTSGLSPQLHLALRFLGDFLAQFPDVLDGHLALS